MKIIISHTQSAIDPAATVPDERFPAVLKSLEDQYERAILAAFPDAEIFFNHADDNYSVLVLTDSVAWEIEEQVQSIMESVYETGTFWD